MSSVYTRGRGKRRERETQGEGVERARRVAPFSCSCRYGCLMSCFAGPRTGAAGWLYSLFGRIVRLSAVDDLAINIAATGLRGRGERALGNFVRERF